MQSSRYTKVKVRVRVSTHLVHAELALHQGVPPPPHISPDLPISGQACRHFQQGVELFRSTQDAASAAAMCVAYGRAICAAAGLAPPALGEDPNPNPDPDPHPNAHPHPNQAARCCRGRSARTLPRTRAQAAGPSGGRPRARPPGGRWSRRRRSGATPRWRGTPWRWGAANP